MKLFRMSLRGTSPAQARVRVLIENAYARKGDANLTRRKSRHAYCGDDVFHVLLHGASRSDVALAIREAKAIPTFLGVLGDAHSHRWGLEIAGPELDDFAESASAVFVGAYDGESFVLLQQDG